MFFWRTAGFGGNGAFSCKMKPKAQGQSLVVFVTQIAAHQCDATRAWNEQNSPPASKRNERRRRLPCHGSGLFEDNGNRIGWRSANRASAPPKASHSGLRDRAYRHLAAERHHPALRRRAAAFAALDAEVEVADASRGRAVRLREARRALEEMKKARAGGVPLRHAARGNHIRAPPR